MGNGRGAQNTAGKTARHALQEGGEATSVEAHGTDVHVPSGRVRRRGLDNDAEQRIWDGTIADGDTPALWIVWGAHGATRGQNKPRKVHMA